MTRKMKILARHKWITKCLITESMDINSPRAYRRFTATILGWRNWLIWEGYLCYNGMTNEKITDLVLAKVREIKTRILNSDTLVFDNKGQYNLKELP